MSHELRTPLNAILGFAQLLEYNDPTVKQAEHIEYILKGGRHLLGLIDEVLDISRIEAGNLQFALEPTPVDELVREALELVAPMARDAQVLIRVDPDAPGVEVMADAQRLKQVLLNLLSNAVKYNRAGGEVRVGWRHGSGDRVEVTVEDTGVGIRPEVMDRLFLPFERLDHGSSPIPGTGLGLALSRGLVHGMDGRIGARSVHGEGSTFWMEMAAAPPATGAGTPAAAEVAALAGQDPPARIRRVLYVEDNLSNLRLVESILEAQADLELIPTLQGTMAVQLATQHRPDLVLLDLDLPDITGDEVLRRLRAEPATTGIPVVVVSADALPARADELVALGAEAFITKPIDVAKFINTIQRILAETAPSAVAASTPTDPLGTALPT
jgi:CheY-like chemotaxis protein